MNPLGDHLPLRDIHLPEPVSWWPPATGWWLLLMLLAAGAALAVFLRHRYNRNALQRAARQVLYQIGDAYQQSGDSQVLVQQLSMWLRRVTLSRYPRQEVAGLTGGAWLRFLDRTLAGDEFQRGVGRVLTSAPYSGDTRVDGPALLQLCERWLHQLFKAKGTAA